MMIGLLLEFLLCNLLLNYRCLTTFTIKVKLKWWWRWKSLHWDCLEHWHILRCPSVLEQNQVITADQTVPVAFCSILTPVPSSFVFELFAISILSLVLKHCSCLFKLCKVHFWCTFDVLVKYTLLVCLRVLSLVLIYTLSESILWLFSSTVTKEIFLYELVRQSGACFEA